MKTFFKFSVYFIIFFVAVFTFLNYGSVAQELRFWLFSESGQADAMTVTASRIAAQSSFSLAVDSSSVSANVNPADGFTISIPKIGISAPIVVENSLDPKTIYRDLKKGAVHYSGSAMIGQPGSAVILGHSWTTAWRAGNYDSVFSLINKLEPGDGFKIQNGGTELIYQVRDTLIFNPAADDPKIDEFTKSDGSSIILVTCWPIGTSLQRIAVKADLLGLP